MQNCSRGVKKVPGKPRQQTMASSCSRRAIAKGVKIRVSEAWRRIDLLSQQSIENNIAESEVTCKPSVMLLDAQLDAIPVADRPQAWLNEVALAIGGVLTCWTQRQASGL
jgi:hypothetical protein